MGVRLLETEHGLGARIDRYDLVAELASGGMATVYLARLSGVGGFQRSFAIKRLHPHLATNADFVQMFFDEARLAALIRHPNVVPILEVGEGSEGYYLVMEYIEGDTFASLLSKTSARGQRMPNAIALRIIVDMLQGLHAAHELKDEQGHLVGLVHRDVSPQNILVGTDGITRITDFGVARAASALAETRSGQLKGKLAYMAPEQANSADDVDRRADVFSSAVVLWEALAFKRLFKSKNEATTLSRVMNEPIVSPVVHNPGIPAAIAALCLKGLERDPARRFSSCSEFAAALERAALSAGQYATAREVADYVQEIIGADVETHRVAIRQWLERRERFGSLPPGSARPSLPPDLSSVTQTSALPPLPPSSQRNRSGVPHAAVSLSAISTVHPSMAPPSSNTQSGVIVTPAARRRRVLLWLAPLVLLLGAAGAWALSANFFSANSGDATQEGAASAGPVLQPTLAAPAVATAAAPVQPTSAAEATLASSAAAPSAEEESPEVAPAADDAPAVGKPRSGGRRGARSVPKKEPAKKGKGLPDLDNPYQ